MYQMHLSAYMYSFQKFPGGGEGMPPDPSRKIVAFGHSGLHPQTINPRPNPAQDVLLVSVIDILRISLLAK